MFLLAANKVNWKHMLWRIMLVFSLFLPSCASREKREEDMLAKTAARMADPVVTEIPITPTEPPRIARVPQDPIPVYKPAKIREVKMDAYVNERGEAFPPSTKYVIEDPGGWNMEALRSPQVAYVPPSSALEIPAAPGLNYTQMTQSSALPGPAQSTGNSSRLLYNLKDVKITGYTEMAQESRARGMASPNEATIFDDKLGWILVPKSVLNATPGAKPRPVERPPRIIPDADIKKGDGADAPPRPSDFDLINQAPAPGPARGTQPVTLGSEEPSANLPQMD